jgi:hypothetical protein
MKIDVVIATISSRKKSYVRAAKSYRDNSVHDVTIIRAIDNPSSGEAWNAGAEKVKKRGDYVHFTGDDLEVLPGWDESAIEAFEQGIYPAPRFVDENEHRIHYDDGAPASWVPFMSWELWDKIGPTLNQHYGCDDWLDFLANENGYKTAVVEGYKIIDHNLPSSYPDRWDRQAREQELLAKAKSDYYRKKRRGLI